MNGERFDALTRLIARGSDRQQSRRSLLRATLAGGLLAASDVSPGVAAPPGNSRSGPSTRRPAVDPLIAELAYQLEYDRDRIIAFVQDEIRYEPYAGALRGPVGTLWSAAGNAVDKAQLLTALLDASSIRTRLVVGAARLGPVSGLSPDHEQTRSATLSDAFGYLINPSGTTPAATPDAARHSPVEVRGVPQ